MNQAVQEAPVFTRRDAIAEPVHDYLSGGSVRKSEWVILGFLVYAVLLGALLPVAPSVRRLATLLNVVILAAYTVLIVVDRTKSATGHSVDPRDLLRSCLCAGAVCRRYAVRLQAA